MKKMDQHFFLPFGIVIAKDNVAILGGEQDMLVDFSFFVKEFQVPLQP